MGALGATGASGAAGVRLVRRSGACRGAEGGGGIGGVRETGTLGAAGLGAGLSAVAVAAEAEDFWLLRDDCGCIRCGGCVPRNSHDRHDRHDRHHARDRYAGCGRCDGSRRCDTCEGCDRGRGNPTCCQQVCLRRCRSFGVDDDPIRLVKREHAVATDVLEVEHDPCRVVRMPTETDVAHDVGVVTQDRRRQARGQSWCLSSRKTAAQAPPIVPDGTALHGRARS